MLIDFLMFYNYIMRDYFFQVFSGFKIPKFFCQENRACAFVYALFKDRPDFPASQGDCGGGGVFSDEDDIVKSRIFVNSVE